MRAELSIDFIFALCACVSTYMCVFVRLSSVLQHFIVSNFVTEFYFQYAYCIHKKLTLKMSQRKVGKNALDLKYTTVGNATFPTLGCDILNFNFCVCINHNMICYYRKYNSVPGYSVKRRKYSIGMLCTVIRLHSLIKHYNSIIEQQT